MKQTFSAILVVFACLTAAPASAKIVFVDPAAKAPAVAPAPPSVASAPRTKAVRPRATAERSAPRETPAWARRLEGAASRARAGR